MSKVLVTGASGFIGLHCIQQLLSKGYHVNGTVRSLSRESEIRKAARGRVRFPLPHPKSTTVYVAAGTGTDARPEVLVSCDTGGGSI